MTNVKCTRCGVVNLLSNEVCKACGLELTAISSIPAVEYPQYQRHTGSPTIGPFDGLNAVLGPSVTLFTKNFWLISKLVLVIVTPFEVFKAVSVGEIAGNWQLTVGTLALQVFCNVLIAPALIYALMKVMQTGVAPTINESYRWALNKLFKLIACTVLVWVLLALGFAMLIIPGIILYLAFAVVYPVAVLENGSTTQMLKRSANLTRGHRWKILGATLCMSFLIALATIPVTVAAALLTVIGINFWPGHAVAAIIADILSQGATILSLVIYLSILRTLDTQPSVIE